MLKVNRGCGYQHRQAQVSHRSQKLVPATTRVIRADLDAGRASVPDRDGLHAQRDSSEALGTISAPWPLLRPYFKQH